MGVPVEILRLQGARDLGVAAWINEEAPQHGALGLDVLRGQPLYGHVRRVWLGLRFVRLEQIVAVIAFRVAGVLLGVFGFQGAFRLQAGGQL